MSEDYAKKTVVALRAILKERSIPVAGLARKQQIVDALIEWDRTHKEVTPEQIEEPAPEQEEEGMDEVEEGVYVSPSSGGSPDCLSPSHCDANGMPLSDGAFERQNAGEESAVSSSPEPPKMATEFVEDKPEVSPSNANSRVVSVEQEIGPDSARTKSDIVDAAPSSISSPSGSPKPVNQDINNDGSNNDTLAKATEIPSPRDSSDLIEPPNDTVSQDSGKEIKDVVAAKATDPESNPQPEKFVEEKLAVNNDVEETVNDKQEAGLATSEMDDVVPEATANGEVAPDVQEHKRKRSASPTSSPERSDKKARSDEHPGVNSWSDLLPSATSPVKNVATSPQRSPKRSSQPAEIPSSGSSAKHVSTASIYISNLMRPIQPIALRRHLLSLCSESSSPDLPESTIQTLYIDQLRSHAFVTFESIEHSVRARDRLHNTVFPDASGRPPVSVDFVPTEEVVEWIKREEDASAQSSGGAGLKDRFEVVYERRSDGDSGVAVVARLIQSGDDRGRRESATDRKRLSHSPTNDRTRSRSHSRTREGGRSESPSKPPKPTSHDPNPESFVTLDSLFQSTHKTKPVLYFLPVSAKLVQKRKDQFRKFEGRSGRSFFVTERQEGRRGGGRDWDRDARDDDGLLYKYSFEGSKLVRGNSLGIRRGGGGGGGGPGFGSGGGATGRWQGGPGPTHRRRGRGGHGGGGGGDRWRRDD